MEDISAHWIWRLMGRNKQKAGLRGPGCPVTFCCALQPRAVSQVWYCLSLAQAPSLGLPRLRSLQESHPREGRRKPSLDWSSRGSASTLRPPPTESPSHSPSRGLDGRRERPRVSCIFFKSSKASCFQSLCVGITCSKLFTCIPEVGSSGGRQAHHCIAGISS